MTMLKPLRDSEPSQLDEDSYDYKDRFFRAMADLDNFKKRMIKEKKELIQYKYYDLFKELIPILDNFDRALQAEELKTVPSISEGIMLIRDSLDRLLASNGLERIDTVGFLFDPHVHEAVGQQPNEEHESKVVIQEVSRGYIYQDKLLIPAKVIVSI
jgi:molecular chaperone GrpE